jgi:hypothetical protein
MYCSKHPKYTGKQKPKNKCFACWKLYVEVNDLSVYDVLKDGSVAEARASWLSDNLNAIVNASLEKKTAKATFVTPAKFVKEVSDNEGPVSGEKI